MQKIPLKKDIHLLFVAGFFLIAASVYAAIGLPWGPDEKQANGFLVMAGQNKNVNVYSECKKVTATTKNVFVPTGNQSEWNNFKTNAPNNNLGVTIGNCGASTVVGYSWNVGTWGACNAECGTQTNQYRTVTCNEMTSLSPKVYGNIVSDAYCSSMTKPLDVQGCTGTNNCAVCNMNGIQDNGETGVDCGGPYCSTCSTVPPTSTISGPVSQCISFGPSTYYKINYYTQTNPQSGYIQDQTYNVAGIGSASFQGYGPNTASWAQPAENPPVNYTNSSCTASTPVTPTVNSCATNPSFANLGQLTTGNPTQPGQGWTYSAIPGNCTYTCTNGYSGDGCAVAPVVNGTCGSSNGQTSGTNPLKTGGNLCSSGNPTGSSSDDMTGIATWECTGNGTSIAVCSAKYSLSGWCSAAEGQTWNYLPSQLCYRGTVISGPTDIISGNYENQILTGWSWVCGGINGGNNVTCNASYAPSGGGDTGGGGCGGAGGSCGE